VFFAGDFPGEKEKGDCPAGGVDFGSNCIVPFLSKPGYMHRCVITPLLRVRHQLFKQETPVGVTVVEALPGVNPLNGLRTDTVHVYLYPGEEWDVLNRQYARWGLTEITTLRGKEPAEVEQLKLTTLFYPDWPNLPVTNKEVIEHLKNRKSFFNKSQHRDVYHEIADEMIAGVQVTQRWMSAHVSSVHAAFKLSEKDSHKRSAYDLTDLHFIEMAGMQRQDDQIRTVSDNQQALIAAMGANNSGMSQEALLEGFKQVLAQNAEMIKEVLGRQTPPPVTEAPPAEAVNESDT
jgi:hypothetical protein